MIAEARKRAYVAINTEAIMVNWRVGTRIRTDILKNQRAEYGKQIIAKLAFRLTAEFGRGWGVQTLQHCVRSAYTFSEEQISYAVRTQLSWTHLRSLMSVESDLARTFYLEMAAIEHWSTRELSDKIQSALYERTAISRKPEELIKAELKKVQNTGDLTPDLIFKSSYILDFLGLKDTYAEEDLEDAILDEIQNFIKELGTDFAFMNRQMRFTVDGIDYKIDLLFYHRTLRRLIAVDLKLGKFLPEYEGQMRLYLRWLNRNDRKAGEESPIGLILCSEGNTEHIEYLMLEDSDIRVAQYYTSLPDVELLKMKLQRAVKIAQDMMAERKGLPHD
ncbi:MAG: DUF1016 domain-containing protein [Lentisphaerae bacterium]|nr:DUF1016 domain-containing protein [Lentisphaerota bacterium]